MVIDPIFFNDNHKTLSMGRNGTMTTIGLALYDSQRLGVDNKVYSTVILTPINSRRVDGNCTIEFPVDKIDEIIKILTKIKTNEEKKQ